jgi:hypothetical protein
MFTKTSTIYKYVKEHYPISKEQSGACEHQVDNLWSRLYTAWTTKKRERMCDIQVTLCGKQASVYGDKIKNTQM